MPGTSSRSPSIRSKAPGLADRHKVVGEVAPGRALVGVRRVVVLPRLHDVSRLGEGEPNGAIPIPVRVAAGVVEVEMGVDDDRHVLGPESRRVQAIFQRRAVVGAGVFDAVDVLELRVSPCCPTRSPRARGRRRARSGTTASRARSGCARSAAARRSHNGLGTMPNIAPPSSRRLPERMACTVQAADLASLVQGRSPSCAQLPLPALRQRRRPCAASVRAAARASRDARRRPTCPARSCQRRPAAG